MVLHRYRLLLAPAFLALCLACVSQAVFAQAPFQEEVVDVGNVGLTITNAGFFGKSNVRNNPAGPPSFEYPKDTGVEHLFESGLWVGAIRSDGLIAVRTGAQTASSGYSPGAAGYEFGQSAPIIGRSSLPTSEVFARTAVSHQDFESVLVDTTTFVPGTLIPSPDPAGRLGMKVTTTTYAWNFPFTEYFMILDFQIENISGAAWDSVYVGMYHDLVVRNVNTTTETGSAFFNKNGIGFVDTLYANYAFNAGGSEETINTYGSIVVLGAEWMDPVSGDIRWFHPRVADEYTADGYSPPAVNPRWWLFSGGTDDESRPSTDQEKYRRMSSPYPDPDAFPSEDAYEQTLRVWRDRLRTGGLTAEGNWIGLTPIGPFPVVNPGDVLRVTFAFVAGLKPEEFQGQAGKPVDNEDSREIFVNNLLWARSTYAGEDKNFNGRLDPGEDINGNGRLDRYLIPEPPASPNVRVVFEDRTDSDTGRQESSLAIYWDRSSEASIDPVTGRADFEGYRIYRSNPGDDLGGNILDAASLVAQWDRPGNRTGFNNGFGEVELSEPVVFEGDTTRYHYRFEEPSLLSGWQYLFTVTAFDEGDPDAGLVSFESSRVANATRVFPGTSAASPSESRTVGVYPNPYRVTAAWDGGTNRTRKINFYNLPSRSEIRIYTLAGEIVATLDHDAVTYSGDIRWYDNYSAENRLLPGGEHSWDLLSESGLSLASGLYLFTVQDLDSGDTQRGKFVIIR